MEMIAAWRERQALRSELAGLPPGELDRVLADALLSRSDLATLLGTDGHVERLLPQVMERFGIDPDGLGREGALVMHDLQRVCGACGDVRHCRHLLAEGGSAERFAAFCPNAETLRDLAPRL
jgi:hypothetical protein